MRRRAAARSTRSTATSCRDDRLPMSDATARVADSTGNWVDSRAPSWSRPYLRLARFDRPIGSWLLLLPCWWSAALAAGIARDVSALPLVLALFFIGAFVMRGAGCTWNDITDRDLDARVERTRSRPIPAGQVSVPQASVSGRAGAGRTCRAAAVQPLRDHDRLRVARHRRGLSVHEADHLVAAGRARPRLLLGRADGICGDARAARRAGVRALCRLDRLGDRLRHHLCASGPRGRCADRREIDRAAVRRHAPIGRWWCFMGWRWC